MTLIKSISGIRGTIGGVPGDGLTPIDVVKYASAYGHWVIQSTGNHKIVIGRDARVSGKMVSDIVRSVLVGLGCEIIDLGLSSTPTVQIAVTGEEAGGGIIVTASHNPMQWNALKLLGPSGQFLTAEEGQQVLDIAENYTEVFAPTNKLGTLKRIDDYFERHIQLILGLKLVDTAAIRKKNFRIAVDGINSTGGIVVPMLLQALGVEHITEFNCEPNGLFTRNPEPTAENLLHFGDSVGKGNFDLGIVVDPDVDRLALICEDGTPFGEEYTIVSISDYVLKHVTGNTVSNLSSSRALKDVTIKRGGKYFASAVGEINVVLKMKEVNAVIGGEGSGGVIYPELHYGRDALVGIALFLTHLANFGKSASMLRSTYPNYFISKHKIELDTNMDIKAILFEIADKYAKYKVDTTDGVRIDFDQEWVHLRKSNTEPIIRIIAESDMQSKSESLAKKMMNDIKEIVTVQE